MCDSNFDGHFPTHTGVHHESRTPGSHRLTKSGFWVFSRSDRWQMVSQCVLIFIYLVTSKAEHLPTCSLFYERFISFACLSVGLLFCQFLGTFKILRRLVLCLGYELQIFFPDLSLDF